MKKEKVIIKLRQGDATNFNNNSIIFRIKALVSLAGWSAVFKLQNLRYEYSDISEGAVELIISGEDSATLEVGTHFGYLQLIDNEGNPGTVYAQEFLILERKVI